MMILRRLPTGPFFKSASKSFSSIVTKQIADINDKSIGTRINIKGWIKGLRNMKENVFFDVNDGSCTKNLQILASKSVKKNLSYGASVDVCGILGLSPRGQLELQAESCHVIGKCLPNDGFPFTPRQNHPPEYIRDYLHLRSRVSSTSCVFRIRHNTLRAFNNFLDRSGFIQIHTPILTANDCEGAGEVFKVVPDSMTLLKQMVKENVAIEDGFFDQKTFLTVSGQLHLEAMCHGLNRVYSLGPIFRAENSKSPVHLAEFYMLEVEKAFVDSIHDISSLIEKMIKEVTNEVLDKCASDIATVRAQKGDKSIEDAFKWLQMPFGILTYKDSIEILEKNASKLKSKVNVHEGLSKEQELFLVNHVGVPCFVVDWPTKMKPFYMKQKINDSELVEALDFLVPSIGELAGGSVREDSYELLKNKIPKNTDWYLDLRKNGNCTTGGFGVGFERYLQFILNVNNIRDVIPFPRWPHNCAM